MNISGFLTSPPYSVAALLDQLRWRAVVYAEFPKTLSIFRESMKTQDTRKTVVLLVGAHLLAKFRQEGVKVDALFVFDDATALRQCQAQVDGFSIVDVLVTEAGTWYPKPLTPQDVSDALVSGVIPKDDLFLRVAQTLKQRKPTVLETTNRAPRVGEIPHDAGLLSCMSEIKEVLAEEPAGGKVPFSVVVSMLAKFTFGMVTRQSVTAVVTRKLPPEIHDVWQHALLVGSSPVGKQFSRAFHYLCTEDATVYAAVKKYGLEQHSKDFTYLTAVFPPHPEAEFVADFTDDAPSDFLGRHHESSLTPPATSKTKKKAQAKKR